MDKTALNLKDAFGYNAEIGLSGNIENRLSFDLSYFQVMYNNRIGSVIVPDAISQNIVYKTNVGNSLTNGLELYAEMKSFKNHKNELSFFTATSYFEGNYLKGNVVVNGENKSVQGNRLETLPRWISRNGIRFQHKVLSATL